MHVERYQSSSRGEWDAFLPECRNATFLHRRDYVEYHAGRFADHSLLVRDAGGLAALLPANQRESVLESHGGLTYGGLLYDDTMTLRRMFDVVEGLRQYLREQGLQALRYRAVPPVYQLRPAQEDLYVLTRCGALLTHRAALAVLAPAARPAAQDRRRRAVRRARTGGVEVREDADLEAYWRLLAEVLEQRYQAVPVHSLPEIQSLQALFPQQIRLFTARAGAELLAGVVVYETERVARLQYIAAGNPGKALGALDLLVEYLVDVAFAHKAWIDFGTSEGAGRGGLNEGVLEFKESWGARTMLHDTYELATG